jgi:ribosomal protein S8
MKKDTIKFLNTFKNIILIKKESFAIKVSVQAISIVKAFYLNGLIQSFYISKSTSILRVFLRHTVFGNLFSDMKIFSTATKKLILSYTDICKINTKKKVLFLSTNVGLLTLSCCKKLKKGGKLYLSFF